MKIHVRKSRRHLSKRFGLSCFLTIAVGASAFGQQFVNGNFSGSTGWTLSDISIGAGYDPSITHTADGSGSVWLNNIGDSTIPRADQELTGLTIGESYTVDFWAVTDQIFDTGDPIRVQLDGVTAFTGPNQRLQDWTHFSFDFVAASTSTDFSVQAEVLMDSDYRVDDFNLTANAAPEPVTVFGVSALVGMLIRNRKRHRG